MKHAIFPFNYNVIDAALKAAINDISNADAHIDPLFKYLGSYQHGVMKHGASTRFMGTTYGKLVTEYHSGILFYEQGIIEKYPTLTRDEYDMVVGYKDVIMVSIRTRDLSYIETFGSKVTMPPKEEAGKAMAIEYVKKAITAMGNKLVLESEQIEELFTRASRAKANMSNMKKAWNEEEDESTSGATYKVQMAGGRGDTIKVYDGDEVMWDSSKTDNDALMDYMSGNDDKDGLKTMLVDKGILKNSDKLVIKETVDSNVLYRRKK